MKVSAMARMGSVLLWAKVMRRRVPLNVMLSVTNRCGGGCVYCRIPQRGGDELTLGQIKSLIDQLSSAGCQRLGLWGGEPLLRDDIGDIIGHAKELSLYVTMDSNGYLLPQKREVLERLDHLVLAFDGEEGAHDANRGQGSYRKLMPAMELARGRIPFWTITVLTKNNLHSVGFILREARKYGFLATFQLLHHNDLLGGDYQQLLPSDKDCREVIREIISQKKAGAPVASSLAYLQRLARWPDFSVPTSGQPFDRLKCRAGQFYCNIDTDGSLYPCSLLVGKTKPANVLKGGFQKAFADLTRDGCRSCLASCYTEYNYLYSLDAGTIMEWWTAMARS